MIGAPKPPRIAEPEYDKAEDTGLLAGQSEGATLEDALQARRQKLAAKKIGLTPLPGEGEEQ